MKRFPLFLCLSIPFLCMADPDASPLTLLDAHKGIVLQNRVLVIVEKKSITVWDVMKAMDFFIHRQNPNIFASSTARFQFYMTNWKYMLSELIDRELMLADAERMKLTVSDADVREEILQRFGPNTMHACDAMEMTYNDVKKTVRDEMIVQRVLWFRVHAKTLASIGPRAVSEAYEAYCKEHPANLQWTYQVLSVRSPGEAIGQTLAQRVFSILRQESANPQELVQQMQKEYPESHIQLSAEHTVDDKDLSSAHKEVLQTLNIGQYSPPIPQISRNGNTKVHRIFFLKDRIQTVLPSFEELAEKIYDELLHNLYMQEKTKYIAKLRERYSFDDKQLLFPEHFQPFSLED